jgi:hypothetical protein
VFHTAKALVLKQKCFVRGLDEESSQVWAVALRVVRISRTYDNG